MNIGRSGALRAAAQAIAPPIYKPWQVPYIVSITVATNLTLLLPAAHSYRRGHVWIAIVLLFLLTTSMYRTSHRSAAAAPRRSRPVRRVYHIDDALENSIVVKRVDQPKFRDVFGMTAGNWHRLDNIGAIFSMNLSTWLHLNFPSDSVRQGVMYVSGLLSSVGNLRAHDSRLVVDGRRCVSRCSARNAGRGN